MAISLRFMPKLPSPVTRITRSPEPICAPMAAPRPKPIVPSPPLETNLRRRWNAQYCAAHIWCCPTSVATIAPSSLTRLMISMAWRGRRCSASSGGSCAASCARSSERRFAQSGRVFWGSLSRMRCSASFMSPVTPTCAGTFLPISAKSVSSWTIVAPFAKRVLSPVARSEKRTPTANTRSASSSAMEEAKCPCMPCMPT